MKNDHHIVFPKINLGMYTSNLIVLTALQEVCSQLCRVMRGTSFKTLVGPFKALPGTFKTEAMIFKNILEESLLTYPTPTSNEMDHQFLVDQHGLVGFLCLHNKNFMLQYGNDNNWLRLDVSVLNSYAIRGYDAELTDRQKRDDAFYVRFLYLTWLSDYVMKDIIFARRLVEPRNAFNMRKE